jgi:hypothetical protein
MLVVTYHGNTMLQGLGKFTTTPAAVASAAHSQRCQFYTFDEPNGGGAVSVEVHLLMPPASIPTIMAAIRALEGVEVVQKAVASRFDVTSSPRLLHGGSAVLTDVDRVISPR